MSPPGTPLTYRRYRAPTQHGEKLLAPREEQALAEVTANAARREAIAGPFAGSLKTARDELVRLAVQYSRQYRDVDVHETPSSCVILAGHQPRLFHPGVWFKNFVIDRLARSSNGIAINLIVDNDLGGSASVRIPVGTIESPRAESLPFDDNIPEIPLEDRVIQNLSVLDSFADRAAGRLAEFGIDPLVTRWWPLVRELARTEHNLGRCLAAARHRLEGEWGLQTLEVPLSSVCETQTFRQFVAYLLGDLANFRKHYNDRLFEYRRINKIRSRSHPVPELADEDGWLEAPLWVWTAVVPQRRRLFFRERGGVWEFTDRSGSIWQLGTRSQNAADVAQAFQHLSRQSVRIRPRALITTLYSRLMLGDYFVHGIGGGKYDQLTDAIWQSWLGTEPPAFLVATATAKLPIQHKEVSRDELRSVERRLRDLRFNPDRYVDLQSHVAPLVQEKRAWLNMELPRGLGHTRHMAIQQINDRLSALLIDERKSLEAERDAIAERLRAERVLGSREYAFCFFPESTLRGLLLDNG